MTHDLYQYSNWNSPWGALLVTLKNRYRVHGGEIRSASLVGVQLLVAKFSSGLFKLAGDCAERQPLYVLVRVGFFFKEEWLMVCKRKQVSASVGRYFVV